MLSLTAGCAPELGAKLPLARDLPPRPSYCRSQELRELRKGDDLRVAHGRRTAEAVERNYRLDGCGEHIDKTNADYARERRK